MKIKNSDIIMLGILVFMVSIIFLTVGAVRKETNSSNPETKNLTRTIKEKMAKKKEPVVKKEEKYHEVDFREAILFYGTRISLNGEEMNENQSLYLSSECTWVVGIHYNKKWHKVVILRDGQYKKVEGTPFSVRLKGSVGLLMPESEMKRKDKK